MSGKQQPFNIPRGPVGTWRGGWECRGGGWDGQFVSCYSAATAERFPVESGESLVFISFVQTTASSTSLVDRTNKTFMSQ